MATNSNDTRGDAPLRKMIEEFRDAKQRQRVRRAMTLWNRTQAQDTLSVIRQPWMYDVGRSVARSKLPATVRQIHGPAARRPNELFDGSESDCDGADPVLQDQPDPGDITPR